MLTHLTKRLNQIFDRTLDIAMFIAGLLLIFQMLSVCLELILRYFFNSPTSWVMEMSAYVVLWVPFLGGAWVLKKDGHVRMDLLIGNVSPKIRAILILITSVIAAVTCLIITWYGIKVVMDLYETRFRTQTVLMLPKYPIMAIIPLSTFLFFIEFLRKIIKSLRTDNG